MAMGITIVCYSIYRDSTGLDCDPGDADSIYKDADYH